MLAIGNDCALCWVAARSVAMKLATIAALGSLAVACASTSAPPATPSSTTSVSVVGPSSSASAGTPAAVGSSAADDLVGKTAPDFSGTAQDGTPVHLADFKGKTVVVYFYPKDETAGCTKEACSFRDAWDAIAKTGAVLIGISADTLDSHKAFATHYRLPFLLVSDPDGAIGRSYGVPFQGRHHRETFIIGADGIVRTTYRQVDVAVHAQQILADLTHKT
jgi:thioredoxin-dependent peroxiredoxin